MTKYYITCNEVGYEDCDYCTEGDSIEQVIERCADHGREFHGLKGFGPQLFVQLRPHIHPVEESNEK